MTKLSKEEQMAAEGTAIEKTVSRRIELEGSEDVAEGAFVGESGEADV